MPTIDNLNATDALDGDDLIPVFRTGAGATRRAALSLAAQYFGEQAASNLALFLQDGAGAHARTIADKLRDTVNAADFAQAGDADATGMIQRAVDAVGAAGGGRILIGPGTYDTAGIVCLHSNVTIEGAGMGATVIRYKGNNASCISFGQALSGTGAITTVANVGVRNLSINGNKASGATGAGIRTTQIDGCLLENVHVYDAGEAYGFAIVGTSLIPRNDLFIRNCRASRCGADGIDIKADFARILIDGFVSHDHEGNNPEEGDSVGIDIRGQYVTLMNAWTWGCPEIGIRVRVNSGDLTNNDAFVSLSNCFAFANNDGFDLSGPATCGIGAANIHAVRNARYGATIDGGGHVQVTGSSFSRNLTGIRHQLSTATAHLSSCQVNGNTSDGVLSISTGDMRLANSSIEGNARYGVNLSAKPSGALELSNTSVKGNLTGIYATLTTACDIRMIGGQITGQTSRGIDIAATAPATVTAIGTRISGNTTNIQSLPASAIMLRCPGYVSRFKGKQSFAIDATGVKSVSFTHGMAKAPAVEDCIVSLVRDTNVNDSVIGWARVVGTSSTVISAQVYVSSASATAGATAFLNCIADIT